MLILFGCFGETYLVQFVLLAELHALLPAVVPLEEVGRDSPELDQPVLLQPLGEGNVVEVVVGVYRRPQSLGGAERKRRGGSDARCRGGRGHSGGNAIRTHL